MSYDDRIYYIIYYEKIVLLNTNLVSQERHTRIKRPLNDILLFTNIYNICKLFVFIKYLSYKTLVTASMHVYNINVLNIINLV